MATPPSPRNHFATTHWSVVLNAAREDSPEAASALEMLCADYWYPLYAFLRRRGHSPADAEDLTQTFFAERIVNRRILQAANPASGRFRSWLLTCLQNLASTEWEHRRTQRRGGAIPHVPIGATDAEERYAGEPAVPSAPEHLYDRAWAVTVIRHALACLKSKYDAAGQQETFALLQAFLPGSGEPPGYDVVALRLGKSVDAVKMSVSRLRRSFRRELQAELSRTVSSPDEVEEELRYLQDILAS